MNLEGSARYVPIHAKTIVAQMTRIIVLTIEVVLEIRVFNVICSHKGPWFTRKNRGSETCEMGPTMGARW